MILVQVDFAGNVASIARKDIGDTPSFLYTSGKGKENRKFFSIDEGGNVSRCHSTHHEDICISDDEPALA